VEWHWEGKSAKQSQIKVCPSANLPTTNLIWTGRGSNAGIPNEKPATNCTSHGTALFVSPRVLLPASYWRNSTEGPKTLRNVLRNLTWMLRLRTDVMVEFRVRFEILFIGEYISFSWINPFNFRLISHFVEERKWVCLLPAVVVDPSRHVCLHVTSLPAVNHHLFYS
jgi:hypothetical protein